jgi:protoheme IX farnesyltransferase
MIGMAGTTYFVGAIVLGLAFFAAAVAMALKVSDERARMVLKVSVLYLPLLLALLAFDATPH